MKRFKGAIVIFENNIEEPIAQRILSAITLIKGVKIVNLSQTTAEDLIVTISNESEIRMKLHEFTQNFQLNKN